MAERTEGFQRTDGRAARWAGQHQRRRAEFVEAALVAIARHGPDTTTEQIADQAGVARTRLYKHFEDAAELERCIAHRVAELITEELAPVWTPDGSPLAIITTGVRTHLRWLIEHRSLYLYLSKRSKAGDTIRDIQDTIGSHLSRLFDAYLTAFGLGTGLADPLAYGITGLVESATSRWLEDPAGTSQNALVEHLSNWIWRILDEALRSQGITLDPHAHLAAPEEITLARP